MVPPPPFGRLRTASNSLPPREGGWARPRPGWEGWVRVLLLAAHTPSNTACLSAPGGTEGGVGAGAACHHNEDVLRSFDGREKELAQVVFHQQVREPLSDAGSPLRRKDGERHVGFFVEKVLGVLF